MTLCLWVLQGILAAQFLFAGFTKLIRSRDTLLSDPRGKWAIPFSQAQIWLIGVIELLGGAGLILPQALGIYPILTPLAASGLLLMMLGAATVHWRAREPVSRAVLTGLLCALIAGGRFLGI